jgi:hypothetical protein
MTYQPTFRDRLDRMRVLTVERGHTENCATAMTYSDEACSCDADAKRAEGKQNASAVDAWTERCARRAR